jgi:choline dehydrogenase-like flavoprotein
MNDSELHEYVVVGSGPGGAIAAHRLLELGKKVLLIDVGDDDPDLRGKIPDLPFEKLRTTDGNQREYFLGSAEEGIPRGRVRVGAHLTPPRQFVRRRADRILSTELSGDTSIMQSLALGGLGAAWGAGIATYSDAELAAAGLDPGLINSAYHEVITRIGASGVPCEMISKLGNRIPRPLPLDDNAESVLSRFRSLPKNSSEHELELGPYPLAALSESREGREKQPLHDMDFYSDSRRSVFRPRYILDEISSHPQFSIRRGLLVTSIKRAGSLMELKGVHVDGGEVWKLSARRVILAAGAIGTARILMNSPGLGENSGIQPLLSNPYRYWVMLNYPRLGKRSEKPRHSLAQLYGLFRHRDKPDSEVSLSFYSYRSLLLFKLVREFPMPTQIGLFLARLIVDSLVIVGVHERGTEGRIRLIRRSENGPAEIRIEAPTEIETTNLQLKSLARRLRGLGLVRLAEVDPGWGSSIHYAGTIPAGRAGVIRVGSEFQVEGCPGLFIGDSSPWKVLPARGLTLTLMAHARSVAEMAAGESR